MKYVCPNLRADWNHWIFVCFCKQDGGLSTKPIRDRTNFIDVNVWATGIELAPSQYLASLPALTGK